MYVIDRCPVCSNDKFAEYLACKDYTVSHETFQLTRCETCSLVMTSPQPLDSLASYYISNSYISHSTKPTSLFDRIYRLARSFNLESKIALIKNNSSTTQKRLLDYGCGTGEFLHKAKDNEYQIIGVEPSEKARTHANLITNNSVYEMLPAEPQSYDIVTLWHVLEHIPDLNEKLAVLANSLSQNGMMFIAVPNHLSSDAQTYGSKWAGYDVPRHLWHFNRTSMQRLLSNHNLKLRKVMPMKLDAFYVSILSEQYSTGRKNLITTLKGITSGLRSNLNATKTNEYSSLIYIAEK